MFASEHIKKLTMKYLDPKADLILKRRFAVKSIIFLTFVISHFRLLWRRGDLVVLFYQKADNFHEYRLFVSYLSELLKPPANIRLEHAVADGRLVRHKGEVVGFALDLDVFVF